MERVSFFEKIIIIAGLIVFLLTIPFILFYFLLRWIFNKIKLRILVYKNRGKMYFIYSDYNEFEFSNYIKEDTDYSLINCIKVINGSVEGVLEGFLIRGCRTKSYPRLVKIGRKELIHKEHYGSFKNFARRKKDPESFFLLLKKSIKRLEKE
ncbi:hypothetical protein SAMN04487765_1370 [Tenacibaculum sp. MAR_2010_89]|uniref:hypothetical protein n=1 Tax=Tenacibaculum sp. MAR_2010_89 TaxID=1250198 RepID=UPI000895C4C0|nr:hypothetical protein [Tenacibaculum sp. MAR_2010_89]SEE09343.1 hypothetical protein SAMN04487765_1370 [Tenacibaculum sp. MAR_2010_89]